MSLPKSYVDGFLIEWEEGGYKAQVKMLRGRSKPIDAILAARKPAEGLRGQLTPREAARRAQAVREQLERTARRAPEVVVKISNNPCRGMRQIKRYVDYISRKGLLELEDQDGCVLQGRGDLADLREEWRHNGMDVMEEESERRETLNIILSMPAATDELSLKRAVRAFAREEFVNHPYVFAYHTPTTDPDPEPPDHPHVHLIVKIEGRDGRRLNPRKADLRRWREGFARQLRAHGIEANASSRLERLQPRPGLRRPRLETANGHGAGSNLTASRRPSARSEHAERLEKARLEYYAAVCRVLATSELISDRRLAQQVARFLQAAKAPTREAERPAQATMRDPKPGREPGR